MTLYNITLTGWAYLWHKCERIAIWIGIMLGYRDLIMKLQSEKEKDMLQRMELLSGMIDSCKTLDHLNTCKDYFLTNLTIPYPEYTSIYYALISNALYKKEQSLTNSNN